MKAHISVLAAFVLLLASGCKTTPESTGGRPPASRFDQGPGGHIPDLARSLIRERMHLHGDDMNDLLWAVLFLDYDSMKAIAQDLAASPRFARPTSDEELNASIPAQFYELQDQLTAGAERLAVAAGERDGPKVAAAFASVSEACVRCHSLYLDEPKTEPVLSPEVE